MTSTSAQTKRGRKTAIQRAFDSGMRDANRGVPRTACRYTGFDSISREHAKQWRAGWDSVRKPE